MRENGKKAMARMRAMGVAAPPYKKKGRDRSRSRSPVGGGGAAAMH